MQVQLWQRFLWWFALAPSAVLGFPCGDGWEWMSASPQLDGAQFMDFASALVQMSANAYRYPGTLHSITGWSLSSQIAPLHPAHGGAHALVFEEHSSCSSVHFTDRPHEDMQFIYRPRPTDLGVSAHTDLPLLQQHPHRPDACAASIEDKCADCVHRVIVAFRGTQIAPTIDSLADLCADKLLWEGLDFGSLPSKCLVFDPYTLDYFSQALNFTLQVIKHYGSTPILLTGHSLGAGLAILVAGALSPTHTLSVIGFGAPGTRNPLLNRGISLQSLEDGRVLVIGHEWDVIMRTQMEGQVGLLCFYPQTESSSCKACIEASQFLSVDAQERFSSVADRLHGLADIHDKPVGLGGLPPGDCMDCFFATHYLKNLIGVVNEGIKPVCEQAKDLTFLKKLDTVKNLA